MPTTHLLCFRFASSAAPAYRFLHMFLQKDVYLLQRGPFKNAFEKSQRAAYEIHSTSEDTALGERARFLLRPLLLPWETQ